MRERLREFIAACFYYSGLVKLALWWKQRTGQQLIVLNYHRADGNLGAQMRYLRRHYRIMHLEEALEEFYAQQAGRQVPGRKNDPRIPMVLTFDDGYLDNYALAAPLARELQVPITIFIIPGYVESGEYFWWLSARKLVSLINADKVTFDGQAYDLSGATGREKLAKAVDARVRFATSIAEREAFMSALQQKLGVFLPKRSGEATDDPALPMCWDQIRELDQEGWVSFGAHTVHHPILACLTDTTEVQCEVVESRQILERELGHPVRTFAYPVGKLRHIGDTALQAVKSAGFDWAVTTLEEAVTSESNPFLLGRFPGDTTLNWMVMACELSGLLGIMSRFKKKYVRFFKK